MVTVLGSVMFVQIGCSSGMSTRPQTASPSSSPQTSVSHAPCSLRPTSLQPHTHLAPAVPLVPPCLSAPPLRSALPSPPPPRPRPRFPPLNLQSLRCRCHARAQSVARALPSNTGPPLRPAAAASPPRAPAPPLCPAQPHAHTHLPLLLRRVPPPLPASPFTTALLLRTTRPITTALPRRRPARAAQSQPATSRVHLLIRRAASHSAHWLTPPLPTLPPPPPAFPYEQV